jgi:chromosome segregation protein
LAGLKIRKLEIQGFKSFADRTAVHFDSGVTCIVGPNGCGKSNVVDALRWCLGEQSAKHLRGDGMQDVIFGGSDARGASGMAEVSITFTNDGGVPGDWSAYPEITISRRLYRSGDSEYLVNKQLVRLKDVQDLVLGTGVGTKGYSIIEQGRIGLIVSAKAEDRRLLIEEAAGITKYKARRQAAERKMDATRQNLVRVGDLVGELGKRLVVLKRQAARAEKYKALKAELRELELHQATLEHLELHASATVELATLSEHQENLVAQQARLAVLEAQAETARMGLLEDEKNLTALQGRLYGLDQEIRLAEQDASHQETTAANLEKTADQAEKEVGAQRARLEVLEGETANLTVEVEAIKESTELAQEAVSSADQELKALAAQRDALQGQAESARHAISDRLNAETAAQTHVEELSRREQELREREGRHREELEGVDLEREAVLNSKSLGEQALQARRAEQRRLEDEHEQLSDQLAEGSDRLRVAWEDVNRLQEELGRKRNRLHGLEEVHQSLARAPEGVRVVMEWARAGQVDGVHGLLADAVTAPAKVEAAVAAALAAHLDDIVVENTAAAAEVTRRLRRQGKGRATMLPRVPRPPAGTRPPLDAGALAADGVVGWLLDELTVREGMEQAVAARLADVLVVKDLAAALGLVEAGVAARVVTLQGDLLGPSGEVTGGAADEASQTYLRQRREIGELTDEAATLERKLNAADNIRARLHFEVEDLKARLKRAVDGRQALALRIVEAEKDLLRLTDQEARLAGRRDALTADLRRAAEQLASLSAERRGHLERLERANTERRSLEGQVAEIAARAAEAEAAWMEANRKATELNVKAQGARERLDQLSRSLATNRGSRHDVIDLIARLEAQVTNSRAERLALLGRVTGDRARALELGTQANALRAQLEEERRRYDEAQRGAASAEAEARTLRNDVNTVQASITDLAVRLREKELALGHLHQRVRHAHQVDLRHVLCDYHLKPLPPAAMRDKVQDLKRTLDGMGDINLTAITECRDVEERHTFLRTQQDDLTHALQQLERAINRINKTTRRRFQEAFEAINARFQELFPRLFRGGKAWLQMTDPNDLLTTGIEIFAQPPGKKLSTVQLLSGGEKALTAVSLVFSIFLLKPSPFCLLDEVDAPLDEANVARFNELVRDMSTLSQFIIITHNKRTMEIADNFYGITMEEPGISKLVNVRVNSAALAARAVPTPAPVAPPA